MRLRHVTPSKNLASILRSGLLKSKSKGRKPAVWLCSNAMSEWAMLHVCKRHRANIRSVVILEVDVPRSSLRRSMRGLWYCCEDVPPDAIAHVVTFNEVARSPIEEPVS